MSYIDLLKTFEGFRATPYRDPTGTYTIGFGTTRITEEEAEYLLESYCKREIKPVMDEYIKVPLNANQQAALVSLIYNIGGPLFIKSILRSKLNSGDIEGAADEFLKFVWSKGTKLPGLVKRREAERALFIKPI